MKALPLLTLLALPGCSFDGPSAKLEFASWKARQKAEDAPLVAPQASPGLFPTLAPLPPLTQILVNGNNSRLSGLLNGAGEYTPRASQPQVEDYSK